MKYYIRFLFTILLSFFLFSHSTQAKLFSTQKFKEPIDIHIRFKSNFDIHFGNPQAPIMITEYISYDCYYCQQYILNIFPKIHDMIKSGKIFYVVKPEIKSNTVMHSILTGYYLFLNHPITNEQKIKARNKSFHNYRHRIMSGDLIINNSVTHKQNLLQDLNIPQKKFDEFSSKYKKRIMKEYLIMQKKINFSPAMVITTKGRSYLTTGKHIYDIVQEELAKLK